MCVCVCACVCVCEGEYANQFCAYVCVCICVSCSFYRRFKFIDEIFLFYLSN